MELAFSLLSRPLSWQPWRDKSTAISAAGQAAISERQVFSGAVGGRGGIQEPWRKGGKVACRSAGAETTSHFLGQILCPGSLGQAENGCA
jgi:hypothetical protein